MAKQTLTSLADIPPGEGRNFELGSETIAVFRTRDGGVYATQARCPHRQGPLADGLVGSGMLVCPLHEWQFDLATGKTKNGSCDLKVYPVSLDASGNIVVDVTEG